MKLIKKFTAFLLIFTYIWCGFPEAAAAQDKVSNAIEDTAEYILKKVTKPAIGSVAGEWAVLGLARSGYSVPQTYYDDYYKAVERYVEERKGILHDKKYTEYSRLILALTAIGKDPQNVSGYNLLEPLGDFEKTVWQGINGPIFALISLDSGDYEIPVCPTAKVQATREMYIDEILSRQLSDGGFALSGNKADPDITGMALQALAKYQHIKSVKTATNRALNCLSTIQDNEGGYSSWGVRTSESTVQVLVALCELGIDINDERFVKNGKTVIDDLMSYYAKGEGFQHTSDGSGVTGMSTEQGFYGLVAYQRAVSGKNSLYRMTDVKKDKSSIKETVISEERKGLSSKNKDVSVAAVLNEGKTFSDIRAHKNKTAIEALAQRGIINGAAENTFNPDKTITRAEFAAIIVKALGLPQKSVNQFKDVTNNKWYSAFVGTAYTYGIVNGKSETAFAPDDTITRQEAAVMISNSAKLCGLNIELGDAEIRDILAQFSDYTKASVWARNGLAFCCKENILSQDMIEIEPFVPIKRCEIAEMVYRLLLSAELL